MSRLLLLLLCMTAIVAPAQEESTPPADVPGETVQNQCLIKRVFPVYPPLARQARIQGTVMLRIIVSKSGDVTELRLLSGHPLLAPAAIEAVRQWKYKPYEVNREVCAVETNVQVNFTLR